MDDRAEVHGSGGVAYADLLRGNSILTYSRQGYGYAVEKAGTTQGWSFAMYEEIWNYGFPQEFAHFVDCVLHDRQPLETGHDGRVVMETLFAAYASAGQKRRVDLPFATTAQRPIDLWQAVKEIRRLCERTSRRRSISFTIRASRMGSVTALEAPRSRSIWFTIRARRMGSRLLCITTKQRAGGSVTGSCVVQYVSCPFTGQGIRDRLHACPMRGPAALKPGNFLMEEALAIGLPATQSSPKLASHFEGG